MADLVTGEAVVVELRLAKLPSRAVALAIDILGQLALFVGILLLAGQADLTLDPALLAAMTVAVVILITVGYPTCWETLTGGRSPGKAALGLRVVRDDGGPIRFRHALVRALCGVFIDFWLPFGFFGATALFVSLASTKGKRVGDLLAGTVVVRERIPMRGEAVEMPPQLAQWAAELELSRLPDDLALAARQYLSRARDLAPDVSAGMAQRLAADVAHYVGREPPSGVPPRAYLAAVVAERRNREMARLMTAQRGREAGAPAGKDHPGVSPPPAHPFTSPSPPEGPPTLPVESQDKSQDESQAKGQEEGRGENAESPPEPPPAGGGFAPPA